VKYMNDGLFTKKSLEKIQSPDSLNETIKVTNPSVWLLLAGLFLLLAGGVVWGIFGRIENTLAVSVTVQDEYASCNLNYEEYPLVSEGMRVRIGNVEGTITSIDKKTGTVTIDVSIPDGLYTGEIITESIQPFSFVVN